MNNIIPILFLIIIITIDIILILLVNIYFKKIRVIHKDKPNSLDYSKSISIGLISGVMVIVLDRVINLAVNNLPKLDTSSFYALFGSIIGILLIIIFLSTFLLFAILYLYHLGLSSFHKKK